MPARDVPASPTPLGADQVKQRLIERLVGPHLIQVHAQRITDRLQFVSMLIELALGTSSLAASGSR